MHFIFLSLFSPVSANAQLARRLRFSLSIHLASLILPSVRFIPSSNPDVSLSLQLQNVQDRALRHDWQQPRPRHGHDLGGRGQGVRPQGHQPAEGRAHDAGVPQGGWMFLFLNGLINAVYDLLIINKN